MRRNHSRIVDIQGIERRDDYSPVRGREPLPPTSGDEAPPPQALLPRSRTLPEPFVPVRAAIDTTSVADYTGADNQSVPIVNAHRLYSSGGQLTRGTPIIGSRVRVCTGVQTAEKVEIIHDEALSEVFPGEQTVDDFTEWVGTKFIEGAADGFRRTIHWRQVPILNRNEFNDELDELPVLEFALAVQSTSWGTIETAVRLVDPESVGEGQEIVKRLTDTIFERTQRVPDPRTNQVGLTSATLDDALDGECQLTLPWDQMTDMERERVTIGAIETCQKRPGARADAVVNLLEGRYNAPTDAIHAQINTLIEKGVVAEPPERYLALNRHS